MFANSVPWNSTRKQKEDHFNVKWFLLSIFRFRISETEQKRLLINLRNMVIRFVWNTLETERRNMSKEQEYTDESNSTSVYNDSNNVLSLAWFLRRHGSKFQVLTQVCCVRIWWPRLEMLNTSAHMFRPKYTNTQAVTTFGLILAAEW